MIRRHRTPHADSRRAVAAGAGAGAIAARRARDSSAAQNARGA
jgi:hypothetical protein